MNTKKIDTIVKKVVAGKYNVESRLSKTSDSYYVNISNGEMKVQLRFADHINPKNKKTKTYIVTNGIKEKSLEGFVRNRVRMLQTISVYHAFDQVSGKVPMKPSFA